MPLASYTSVTYTQNSSDELDSPLSRDFVTKTRTFDEWRQFTNLLADDLTDLSAAFNTVNNTAIVTETGTQTLTNKTLTSPSITGPTIGTGTLTVNSSALAGTAIVTSSEGISNNNNNTTIPTSAAVKAYADSITGSISGLTTSALAAGSLQLSSESFTDSDSVLMTAAAIEDFIDTKVGASGGGTVTNVSGTGSVNGLTLTGTVTTTGSLTLGGSISGLTLSQLSPTAVQTGAEVGSIGSSIADNDTTVLTAAAVINWVEGRGYLTSTSGDISAVTAGSGLTGGGTSGSVTLNIGAGDLIDVAADSISVDLSELTTSVEMVGTDEFVILDAGEQRRIRADDINISIFNNNSGFTTNTGTVTSVSGTGSVSGLTLSGSVTSTGSLTLGGSITGLTTAALAAGSLQLSSESFTDSDSVLMTAKAIDDRIDTKVGAAGGGTVTSVSVANGGGLSVSGSPITTSGTITLTVGAGELIDVAANSISVDLSELTDMTATMVGADEFVILDAGEQRRKAANEIGLGVFINDSGFTTNTGTVTSVSGGNGLTGSITTSGSLNVGAGAGISVGTDSISVNLLGLQSLTDPNDDRIFFWDDSAGASKFLDIGTNLAISGTTLNATNTDTTYTASSTGGLSLSGTAFSLKNAAGLSNGYIPKWNTTSDQFENSSVSDSGTAVYITKDLIIQNVSGSASSSEGAQITLKDQNDENTDALSFDVDSVGNSRIFQAGNGNLQIGNQSTPGGTGKVKLFAENESVLEVSSSEVVITSGNDLIVDPAGSAGVLFVKTSTNVVAINYTSASDIDDDLSLDVNGATRIEGELVVNADVVCGDLLCETLSKSSGYFKIDHPLESKSDTHYLVHSFIEGPQADLIYRGKVTLVSGGATINIDTHSNMTEGTFVVLCRDIQSFTTNETGWTAVRSSVSGNILTIEAQDSSCTDTISWMVVGERQDPAIYSSSMTDDEGKVIVEKPKS